MIEMSPMLSLLNHYRTTTKKHSADQTFYCSLLRLRAKPDKALPLRCGRQTRTVVKRASASIWLDTGRSVTQ